MARKMKDSGIEWIGEIPEGWEVVPVKRLCTMQAGKNLTSEQIAPEGTYPVYGGNGIRGFFSDYNCDGQFLTVGRQGALCGNVHKINGKVWATEHAVITAPSSYAILDFLYYLLIGMDLNQYVSSTAAQPGLAVGTLLNLKTCYPCSTLEQTQISNYLNAKCSEIDTMLSRTRSSIEEYKKLKQAVITQAVTKGVRGEREMKDSGNPWFGQIPADWKLSRVGLHFSVILGKMLCNAPLNDTYTLEPYYCAADVHFDGVADGERKKMWFSPVEKELYRVSVGDLLVVEGGAGAGGSAIVEHQDSDTYIQNSIMIVRSKGSADNRYLRYLLEFLVKQGYIDIVCNKATIPHFTKDKLSCVPFCLCPTGEQKEIADYLDAKCTEIDGLIAKKEQLVKELESYKKSLIYEVVTGKREV